MGRISCIVILLFLLAPAAVPADAPEASLPGWRRGDRWEYEMIVQAGSDTHYGNLSLRVTGEEQVRVGNSTVGAYTLSASRSELSRGVTTTAVSTIYIEKATLSTLLSNTTSRSSHGDLSAESRLELRFSPSDGRYSFPLGAGQNWTASYNLTSTLVTGGRSHAENLTVSRQCSCQEEEKVNITTQNKITRRYLAYRISSYTDGGGLSATYWYSESVRGEVMREEFDPRSATLTTYLLTDYEQAAEPSLLADPDFQRALLLTAAALALVLLGTGVVVLRRRLPRLPQEERQKEEPLAVFRFEQARSGMTMKLNTKDLACPSCRRVFKVAINARTLRCPFCGREGSVR